MKVKISEYSFTHPNLTYLEGELLTHIEVLGLKDTQEEAFKSSFRRLFWGWVERNGKVGERVMSDDNVAS